MMECTLGTFASCVKVTRFQMSSGNCVHVYMGTQFPDDIWTMCRPIFIDVGWVFQDVGFSFSSHFDQKTVVNFLFAVRENCSLLRSGYNIMIRKMNFSSCS